MIARLVWCLLFRRSKWKRVARIWRMETKWQQGEVVECWVCDRCNREYGHVLVVGGRLRAWNPTL